jgi:hypothetical protein
MHSYVLYSLHYKILSLRDTKTSRHNLFQNNLSVQFSYTLMNIQKTNVRKLQEIELPRTKTIVGLVGDSRGPLIELAHSR